jgi:hypothetical protein
MLCAMNRGPRPVTSIELAAFSRVAPHRHRLDQQAGIAKALGGAGATIVLNDCGPKADIDRATDEVALGPRSGRAPPYRTEACQLHSD